jgi:hypothetical protein
MDTSMRSDLATGLVRGVLTQRLKDVPVGI